MFGHDDSQGGQQSEPADDQSQNQFMGAQLGVPAMPDNDQGQPPAPANNFGGDLPAAAQGNATAPADTPNFASDTSPPAPVTDLPAQSMDDNSDTGSAPSEPSSNTEVSNTDTMMADDSLLALKQQALQQLTPLVDHLEQTPEEEFRTTMMMIQAADNKDLIQKAYDAAQKITDEKSKAQALLDIVNEINYFTQHQK